MEADQRHQGPTREGDRGIRR
ncbi:hypothetical protein Godav_004673 [Gossypium davidsonii]|uniref:Uncharacterized protein n=1 Tax=Gossypium davidsonii TaxID=34287 RepID=A0A7J8SLY1_GOSDV|nr:hypothetical protein [Gossypium davidsonii]